MSGHDHPDAILRKMGISLASYYAETYRPLDQHLTKLQFCLFALLRL